MFQLIIFGVSVLIFIVAIILLVVVVQCFAHHDENDENQEKMKTITTVLLCLKEKVSQIAETNVNSNSNANISASLKTFNDKYDKLADWLNNTVNPAIDQIAEIHGKVKSNDLRADFQNLFADLRQKESCCIKEKLSSQGIPADFQDSLGDIYQFIVTLEKDFSTASASSQYSFAGQTPSQKNWKNVLEQIRSKIDDFYRTAEQVPNLNQEKNTLQSQVNEQGEQIKALQSDKEQAQKKIDELNETLTSQKADSEKQRNDLCSQHETQMKQEQKSSAQRLDQEKERSANLIAATKSSFAAFAPEEILALFNVSLENLDKAGKRSMAVYSYLSLLKELRGSSFVKRFASFDRDLYIAFQGDELRQVRKKIEENLNPQILSEGFKIAWAIPGERINPDIHYDDTNLGQVIAKVKSAVVYRLDDSNNWKCDSTGTVETR